MSYSQLGSVDASFTKRSRHDLYDVMHFELQVVIDARDMLAVVNELCKKRLFTPLVVSYQAVDAKAARDAGYLYGSEPAVRASIVCEALFLRKNYESLMPQEVKDMLTEQVAAEPTGREMDRYMR